MRLLSSVIFEQGHVELGLEPEKLHDGKRSSRSHEDITVDKSSRTVCALHRSAWLRGLGWEESGGRVAGHM